jgi:ATP-dependent DNA ligase
MRQGSKKSVFSCTAVWRRHVSPFPPERERTPLSVATCPKCRCGDLLDVMAVARFTTESPLERIWHRLQPVAVSEMPLEVLPPRTSRFGSLLVLSRVHWVRPELVVEVKSLTWTDDNLLRQVIYQGLREDKPPTEVRRRRSMPHPKPTAE